MNGISKIANKSLCSYVYNLYNCWEVGNSFQQKFWNTYPGIKVNVVLGRDDGKIPVDKIAEKVDDYIPIE